MSCLIHETDRAHSIFIANRVDMPYKLVSNTDTMLRNVVLLLTINISECSLLCRESVVNVVLVR